MIPGDKVMIYEDPVTQKRPEGRGRLIKKLGDQPKGIAILLKRFGNQTDIHEYWQVRFMDGMVCKRWIKTKEEPCKLTT